jgi:AraC-like DNA-binding protein
VPGERRAGALGERPEVRGIVGPSQECAGECHRAAPMAYLARQRVEAAAEQLLHTESSVSQIGRAVGWPDQNYFARRFKAHFGLSATEYGNRFAHRTRQFEDLRAGGRGS